MTDLLRIAQIGIAHTHANKALLPTSQSILDELDVEFVGIYEPDPEMWESRHNYDVYKHVRWFESIDDLLKDETIDGILIETWPWECQDWARQALDFGKHIHLDKPPGLSLRGLKSLYKLADQQNLFIQMGYQWRFNSGFEFLQQSIADGLLGRVTFARFRAGSTPEYYHRNHVERFPGGILQEESSHLFDQVVWMFGRADKITPVLHSDSHGFDDLPQGIDNAVVVLEYHDQGAIAVIEATSLETDPSPHRRVEVHGLDGSLILEPIEPPSIDLCVTKEKSSYRPGWQRVPVENRPRYVGDLEEFIQVIRGKRNPRFSSDHDLLVQETMILACGGDL